VNFLTIPNQQAIWFVAAVSARANAVLTLLIESAMTDMKLIMEIMSTKDGLEKCLRTAQYISRFVAGCGYNNKGRFLSEFVCASWRQD